MRAVPDWIKALKVCLNSSVVGMQRATFTAAVAGEAAETKETETRVPHVFRFTKHADGQVVMHYKEYCADAVWLPPQNPKRPSAEWVTDPEGIEMFASGRAPADPVSMHLEAASYVGSY